MSSQRASHPVHLHRPANVSDDENISRLLVKIFDAECGLTIIEESLVVGLGRDRSVLVLLTGVVVVRTEGPGLHLLLPPVVLLGVQLLAGLHHVAAHDESLLDQLELGDELLLLQLQLVQGGTGLEIFLSLMLKIFQSPQYLGTVSLQQVGLLDKVHLQLLLQAQTVTIFDHQLQNMPPPLPKKLGLIISVIHFYEPTNLI